MYAVFDTATALINGVGKEIGEPYIRDNIECAAKQKQICWPPMAHNEYLSIW